jgi:hypothetical protein
LQTHYCTNKHDKTAEDYMWATYDDEEEVSLREWLALPAGQRPPRS